MAKSLSASDKLYIQKNYTKKSIPDIAKHLGYGRAMVGNYMRRNNLKMSKAQMIALRSKKMTGRTTFTADQDAFIKDNYLTMPVKTIGRHIGKSYTGIMYRLKNMGLEIPRHIVEARAEQSRFKMGHLSHNKGKRLEDFMSPEGIEKFKSTSFKPGHTPSNSKYDGHQRITKDGYIEVRVCKGNYQLKQRLVWQQNNGPIPKGHVVTFKDGNKQNTALSNLKLITMKQNMLNNSLCQYPVQLQQTIKLINKINKQL